MFNDNFYKVIVPNKCKKAKHVSKYAPDATFVTHTCAQVHICMLDLFYVSIADCALTVEFFEDSLLFWDMKLSLVL